MLFYALAAKLNGGRIIERIAQVRNLIAELRSENGRIIFPRSIKGNININGKRMMPFLFTLVKNIRLPIVEELTPRHRARRRRMQLKVTFCFALCEMCFHSQTTNINNN